LAAFVSSEYLSGHLGDLFQAGSPGLTLLSYLATAVSAFFSVWVSGKFFDHRPFREFGFGLDHSWWADFGFGLLLGAILMTAIFLIEYGLGWVTISGYFTSTPPRLPFSLALLIPLLIFILVGSYEELIFRGYQLTNLAEGMNPSPSAPKPAALAAAILSSLLFALMHADNPHASFLSTCNIFLAGLLLASGYLLTGQLAIPIGLHVSWNFFQGNIFGFPVSGGDFRTAVVLNIHQRGPDLWTGGSFGPEGGLLGTIFPLVGILIILLWVKGKSRPAELFQHLADPPRERSSPPLARSKPADLYSRGQLSPDAISHLIWDWNGTLLNDLDLCLSVINSMLRKRDLPEVTSAQYLEIFGFPVQNYYTKLGFDFQQEPFEAISTEFITAYEAGRPGCQLMEGAEEILDHVARSGITQSILSASRADYLNKALLDYGIESYFCAVNGLDNHHAAGKTEIAREFMAAYHVQPRHTLLVGDTLHDAEIAGKLGIGCLLVSRGHQDRQRLKTAGVPVLDSLYSVREMLP
jgi:phosphoglycolate phosphatase-like HAD superfamily hydrolase/membrane protease YdiL (CAAX protease family)